jgi:hypothetical protein
MGDNGSQISPQKDASTSLPTRRAYQSIRRVLLVV